MKALVTGSAGFIASHLTRALHRDGVEVVGVDAFTDSYDVRLKRWRIDRLLGERALEFHELDVAREGALDPLFARHRFDVVYHLGARAGVRQSIADPRAYLDANATGTLSVLEAARRHDVARVLVASTSSLYGNHNPRPFREDANTDRPLSPYAASKKAAEAMAASYAHLYGIHTPVCRFFTVYGPAGRPDMSVFRFIEWISRGSPITLYGDGRQERDFTFVEDIVRGARLAAERVDGFDIVNLGNDDPHSILDLLGLIEKELGVAARLDRRPSQAADVQATRADITKARTRLGWAPTTTLAEGVRRTVAWHRDNRDWLREIDLGE